MSALPAGYAEGLEGPIELQRWCRTCAELVLFDDRDHKCLWCETETVPAAEAAMTERRRPMAIAPAATTCKIDGCEEEPTSRAGIYAGLCDTHRDEARANRQPAGGGSGYVSMVRQLLPLARELDKAKRKLETVGVPQTLRAELQEATSRATAQPNPDNLERLEKAAKALRKAAGKSGPAETAHTEAERKFKLALGAIAADFRAGA